MRWQSRENITSDRNQTIGWIKTFGSFIAPLVRSGTSSVHMRLPRTNSSFTITCTVLGHNAIRLFRNAWFLADAVTLNANLNTLDYVSESATSAKVQLL